MNSDRNGVQHLNFLWGLNEKISFDHLHQHYFTAIHHKHLDVV